MSAGGEELIRELCDALNAGDVERAADLAHPDVVQYGTRGGIDQDRVFRGRQAVVDYWNDVGDTWASIRYEPERIIESGELIVVFWHETARSTRSELEVETETGAVFKVRDGKIVELRGYMDRAEALRAAGLAS
jgi:ketosteroid isomerase-like protein